MTENPGRNANLESSPTVVTSMSDSSLLPHPSSVELRSDPEDELREELAEPLLEGMAGTVGRSHKL